jgi:cellulose synthase/poly-beta-1,6-N-acetylglucosamine synthase-like glycosyltransferase
MLFYFAFVLLLGYAALLAYYSYGWYTTPFFKPNEAKPSTFITVIIPCRNEEQHIEQAIACVAAQNYPADLFELIVVDDFSTDKTTQKIEALLGGNIRLLHLKDFVPNPINSYKKKAIEVAIEHSQGSLLVTSDADCLMPANWLRSIANFYETKSPALIAMPVVFNHRPQLLSVFQTIDFLTLQGITAAGVQTGFHTMCNGANLAYSKVAYEKVGGFKGIDHIASGDDMLLMHKIYHQYPQQVSYLKSPDVIVGTQTAKNWEEFYHQRVRWASKGDKYEDKRIVAALVWVYLVNVLMLLLVANAFFSVENFWLLLATWGFKTLIELPLVAGAASFFSKQSLLWTFHFLQPLHWCYMVWVGLMGKFGKYNWKGRAVK